MEDGCLDDIYSSNLYKGVYVLQQALLDNERRRKLENAAYGHAEMPMVNNKKEKKVVQVNSKALAYL